MRDEAAVVDGAERVVHFTDEFAYFWYSPCDEAVTAPGVVSTNNPDIVSCPDCAQIFWLALAVL